VHASPVFELCRESWPRVARLDYDPVMEPISSTDALRVRAIRCTRGAAPVLRDLSLTLPAGARLGIVGGNGAGKTTLVRVLVGLLRAQAGTVHVFGQPAGSPAAGRRLGWLPDRPVLPTGRVRAVLATGCTLTSTPTSRIPALCSELGLTPLLDRPADRLSLGQSRSVALALALLHAPALLVLDEPLTALDPSATERLHAALRARSELAVLCTGHDPSALQGLTDRVRVLRDGTLHEPTP